MNSPISPPLEADARCQTLSPTTSRWISLGMNLRDRSKKGCLCLHLNQTLQQRQREHEGVKNAALSNNPQKGAPPALDPPPGLTETGQTPTTHPAILPAPRAPPDSSGIRDRDPTRSTAGRRISTILRFTLLLSEAGILVLSVWLRCLPSSVFWYCFCSRARVTWVVTSEFDGKWIANSDRNERWKFKLWVTQTEKQSR